MLRIVVVICVIVGMAACTTQRAMTRPTPGTVAERVEVGDAIRVFGRNGKFYQLQVTEVGDGYLRGVNRELQKRYRIPVSQIERMEYAEFSAAKTAGAVVGGTWVATLVVGALLVAAFDGLEFGFCTDDGVD